MAFGFIGVLIIIQPSADNLNMSHEKDLAHKIQEEMELKKIVLMANFSGFR